jgi:hypothetical protein
MKLYCQKISDQNFSVRSNIIIYKLGKVRLIWRSNAHSYDQVQMGQVGYATEIRFELTILVFIVQRRLRFCAGVRKYSLYTPPNQKGTF